MDSQIAITLQNTSLQGRFFEYAAQILDGGYICNEKDVSTITDALIAFKANKQGIILFGGTGSGKTMFFDILQKVTKPFPENKFIKTAALDLVLDFNIDGHVMFRRFKSRTNVFFDDLGTEDKGIYFGDKVEVFEKMLQWHYELWRNHGIKTHITTNLTKEEIHERYGDRVWSRLNEMCQWFMFNFEDKRKLKNFKGFIPVIDQKKEQENIYAKSDEEAKTRIKNPITGEGIGAQLRKSLGILKK